MSAVAAPLLPRRAYPRSYWLGIVAIAGLYLLAGEVALRLHELGAWLSLIWVPSGLGLAIVLLYGPRWWPGIAVGTFLVVVIRHHPVVALVTMTTETIEILISYYVLHELLDFRPQLDRVRDVLAFVVVDVCIALLGACLGALALYSGTFVHDGDFVTLWATWWWVNLSGDLIVAPAVLTWVRRSPTPSPRGSHEVVALVVVGLLVALVILASWLPPWLPAANAPYYLLPLMLWAGVRFGPRGAATASIVASLAAIIADTLGIGPFPERGEMQAFITIASVTTLVLSALAQERVCALVRKSAIQRGALDAIITIDTTGRVLELNPAAEQLFKMREADAVGRDLATLVIPPRLRDAYYRGLHRYAAGGPSSIVGARYRTTAWRAADGEEFPVEIAVTRPPVDDQHVLTGFVRDISAQHAAEVARREASAELERKVAERTAELRESVRQGDVLLREIHHRVKNNLQVISSMLNLQATTAHNEDARLVLLESQNRIAAMALVHQLLYRSKEIGLIDFGDYLHRLIERLADAYNVDASRIELAVDAPAIYVDLDRAIPCGLIVNELVTNALLHAFPGGRRGRIRIGLAHDHELVALTVADDGIGLPASIDLDKPHTFGLKIVHSLAKQIDGTTSRLPGAGTTIRVAFPLAVRP